MWSLHKFSVATDDVIEPAAEDLSNLDETTEDPDHVTTVKCKLYLHT